MFKWSAGLAAALLAVVAFNPTSAKSDDIDVILALPSPTLTFSAPFVAEAAGLYKKEGLNVTHRMLVGVAAVNAVIAGSADFTIGTGPVFLRAASQGQRLLTIANLIDKPLVELVLRKDVAEAAGITEKTPFKERAAALKGKTIAIQGVGSIIHAWERLVVARGGLDIEKDVRIAPMDPPAMRPAMLNKAIDGFATSLPFTTEPVVKGEAMMLASFVTEATDLHPFAYGLLQTKAETCQQNKEKCIRIVRALAAANKMIKEEPAKALDLLRKRFDKMDPSLLEAAFKVVSSAHASDLHVTVPMLEHSEQVSIEAKLLKPEDALKKYDGLFTGDYLK